MSLTELVGDVVRDIDTAISGARPFAATRGAGVSILETSGHCNITFCDIWVIKHLP